MSRDVTNQKLHLYLTDDLKEFKATVESDTPLDIEDIVHYLEVATEQMRAKLQREEYPSAESGEHLQ